MKNFDGYSQETIDRILKDSVIITVIRGVETETKIDCSTCKFTSESKYIDTCHGCRDFGEHKNYEKQ